MKINNEALTYLRKRKRRIYVAEYEKKRKRIMLMTISALVSIWLLITLVFGNNGLMTYFKLKAATERYGREIEVISTQNNEIRKEIEAIKNGNNFFEYEQRARELGFTYRGEIIYRFNKPEIDKYLESERSHNEK